MSFLDKIRGKTIYFIVLPKFYSFFLLFSISDSGKTISQIVLPRSFLRTLQTKRQDNLTDCLTVPFSTPLLIFGKTISLIVLPRFETARQSAGLSYRDSKRQDNILYCLTPSIIIFFTLLTHIYTHSLRFFKFCIINLRFLVFKRHTTCWLRFFSEISRSAALFSTDFSTRFLEIELGFSRSCGNAIELMIRVFIVDLRGLNCYLEFELRFQTLDFDFWGFRN